MTYININDVKYYHNNTYYNIAPELFNINSNSYMDTP